MKIEHISVSRSETYRQCPQKYKYRYELGILPEKTPFHFTFGKIAHKIIEKYTESHGLISLPVISRSVLDGEIEIEPGVKAPKLNAYDLNRLNEHITNFSHLSSQIGVEGEVEWAFNIDLDPPNNRRWVGFIDRLIQKGDKFWIIDYKTTRQGKWRKDRLTIKKDLQIMGYCYVVRETFKVPSENVRAALYYLEDNSLVDSGFFSEETLNSVPKKLLETFKEIELTNPDHVIGKVGEHCKNCEYNQYCPFYKKWRTGQS